MALSMGAALSLLPNRHAARRSRSVAGRLDSERLAGQRHDFTLRSPQAIAAILNENPPARLSPKSGFSTARTAFDHDARRNKRSTSSMARR